VRHGRGADSGERAGLPLGGGDARRPRQEARLGSRLLRRRAGGEEGSFIPFDPKTGKALEDARIAADFYAPLGWKSHFKTVEIKRMVKEGARTPTSSSSRRRRATP
jgi:hypothetical protein